MQCKWYSTRNYFWYQFCQDNDRAIARARKDFLIRHHLDRTTGVGMWLINKSVQLI